MSIVQAHFAKKGPYHALHHLVTLAGHAHFLSVIKEDTDAYIYVLGDLSPLTPTHLVAWRPVDAALDTSSTSVSFTFDQHPAHAWQLSMTSQQGETSLPAVQGDRWTMQISAMPTVVELRGHGGPIVG
jgi:hypothetical protein